MEKYGVIDLGTNTFHLLIVEKTNDSQFEELYRNRVFVKLAEEGIETIGKNAFQRGLDALLKFQSIIDLENVEHIRAFGTAALRTASNGQDFIESARKLTGIQVQLIDGNEEARLIHRGVSLMVDFENESGMIMDIGGGSVEFIIADNEQTHWAHSFPVGVAVLHNKFHATDPISQEEVDQLHKYLEKELAPLLDYLKSHPVKHLIGASGTFDVMEVMIPNERLNDHSTRLDLEHFSPLYQLFVNSRQEERLQMENLPESRAEMIVVAIILIDFILRQASIDKLTVTSYAMKEGMLSELIEAEV